MLKIAIFVEGQAELIFARELIYRLFDYNVDFTCHKLQAGRLVPSKYKAESPNSNVSFLIVNAQSDGNVLTAIKDRETLLYSQGFTRIFALRDMLSEDYIKVVKTRKVDNAITQKFIDGFNKTISTMINPENIKMFFSIMEIEAWLLAMSEMYSRINPSLTVYQFKNLGVDISNIEEIFHPAVKLKNLMESCGLNYTKHENEVEMLVSYIEDNDINMALDRSRSFKNFYNELISIKEEAN